MPAARKILGGKKRSISWRLNKGLAQSSSSKEVLGAGAGLWENDREFEDFLQEIYRRRKETRGLDGE